MSENTQIQKSAALDSSMIVAGSKVSEERAIAILSQFADPIMKADLWFTDANNLIITGEDDKDGMALAHEKRMTVVKARTSVASLHKAMKADAMAECNAIDIIKRELTSRFEAIEEILKGKEDFAKNKAIERAQAVLSARSAQLAEFPWFTYDPTLIMNMDEALWSVTIAGVRSEDESRKAREKEEQEFSSLFDEAQSENRRIDREELDRLEAENKKLEKKVEKATAKVETLTEEREAEKKLKKELKTATGRRKLLYMAEVIDAIEIQGDMNKTAKAIYLNAKGLLAKTSKYIRDNAAKLPEEE